MAKFNFIELDKTILPKTKGMRVDGHRFYITYQSQTNLTYIGQIEGQLLRHK